MSPAASRRAAKRGATARALAATAWLAAMALGGCRGGCGTGAPAGGRAATLLQALPAETQVVIGIDFARLRRAPLWARLAPLTTTDAADRARIEEFAARTGLDPLRQIDAVLLAFPEQARRHGEMALVVRGRGFDQARLLAYARDQAAKEKQGDDLFSFQRAGQTLWATRKEPTTAAFFSGPDTLVLGTGGWAEKMAVLVGASSRSGSPAPAATAADDRTLLHLVERAGPERAVWAAAIVPAATRAELAANPAFASAASVNHLAASIELTGDLGARLIADLATATQAEELAHRLTQALKEAKRSPQILLLGVGPYLDGVRARADGVSCEVTLALPGNEVVDLAGRLQAAVKLMRQGAPPGFPR